MLSITGAPKLPIGGFRGLNPPFTVVRKPHEAPFRADDYLPSVMTCAQVSRAPKRDLPMLTAFTVSQDARLLYEGGPGGAVGARDARGRRFLPSFVDREILRAPSLVHAESDQLYDICLHDQLCTATIAPCEKMPGETTR